MGFLDSTGLTHFYTKIKEHFIQSVTAGEDVLTPDENGNVTVTNVPTADNLTSPDAQASFDTFIYRTSGGSASLSSGDANLIYIDGNISISGRVLENFEFETENNIVLTVNDAAAWRSYFTSNGTYSFQYVAASSSEQATSSWIGQGTWLYNGNVVSLSTYGLEANLTNPIIESEISSVGITTVKIIPDTWMNMIFDSGEHEFTYIDNGWYIPDNETPIDLEDYGLSFTGSVTNGDIILIHYTRGTPDSLCNIIYTAPVQGTITVAKPTAFSATGFNQCNPNTMCLENMTIENGYITSHSGTNVCYCKAVGGVDNGYVAYSSSGQIQNIGWCATLPQEGSAVSIAGQAVEANLASIPFDENGYVVVVVGNKSDICIHPKWSGSADTIYQPYRDPDVIDIPAQDTAGNNLPIWGMPRIGNVADRINLETGQYIQNIGWYENTPENMAEVVQSGVDYDYDAQNIYYVISPIVYNIDIDSVYQVEDFGTEEFLGTTVPVGAQTLYGQNLRDKLRTDVLTISPQELNAAQQQQIRANIGINNDILRFTNVPCVLTSSTSEIMAYVSDVRITSDHILTDFYRGDWWMSGANGINWYTTNGSAYFTCAGCKKASKISFTLIRKDN